MKNKNIFLFLAFFLLLVTAGCDITGGDGLSIQEADSQNNDPQPIGPPPGLMQYPPKIGAITVVADKNKISLSWEDLSPYEEGFEVWRDEIKVGSTDRNASAWTDIQVISDATYCYTVIAHNKEYKFISEEKCVAVPENHHPVVSGITAPATMEAGKKSSISCQTSDQDNDPLTYSWSAKAGIFSGSGSNIQWVAPATAGTYTIQCDVSDGKGSATGTTDVIITVPVPPKWILPQDVNIRSLAVDQSGDVYAAGTTKTSPTDIFLAKFNSDGELEWEKQWGTTGYDLVLGDFLAISNGNIYVLCQCNDISGLGGGNTHVTVFNSQGDILRIIDLGDVGAESITSDDSGTYVVYGENNTSYIAKINHQVDDPMVWVVKAHGYVVHAKVYGGAIYFISDMLYKIDTNTGNALQTTPLDGQYGYYFDSSAIDTSGVYLIGGGIFVPLIALKYSHDLINISTSIFSAQSGLLFGASPVLNNTSIYIASKVGLFKLDKATLDIAWERPDVKGSAVALVGDTLLVVNENKIFTYNSDTGKSLP